MSFVLLLLIVGLIFSNPIGMKDFNGVLRNRSQCMVGGCIDRFVKKFGEQCLSQEIQGPLVSALSVSLCSILSLTISMTLTLPFNLSVCAHACVHTLVCTGVHVLWHTCGGQQTSSGMCSF